MGASARDGCVRREGVRRGSDGTADHHQGQGGSRVGAGIDRAQVHAENLGDPETAADAGHHARGRQERLEDPRARGQREPGQCVLDRAEEVHARQQHHDAASR